MEEDLGQGFYIEMVASSDATIAFLGITIDGVPYEWQGTAKRTPGDKFNPEVGAKLALSRALGAASRQLERQGNGLVKCADDNRRQAQEASERKIPKAYRVKRSARTASPKAEAKTASAAK